VLICGDTRLLTLQARAEGQRARQRHGGRAFEERVEGGERERAVRALRVLPAAGGAALGAAGGGRVPVRRRPGRAGRVLRRAAAAGGLRRALPGLPARARRRAAAARAGGRGQQATPRPALLADRRRLPVRGAGTRARVISSLLGLLLVQAAAAVSRVRPELSMRIDRNSELVRHTKSLDPIFGLLGSWWRRRFVLRSRSIGGPFEISREFRMLR
uniref:Uncharacterized protein n=1 Tax=Aegilops tauschii subsp. strangulata TaxID=200361 RepID=A0A453G8T5_AEGTS